MKTVKVRIAVAVDRKGDWSSAGWNTSYDDARYARDAFGSAVENLDEGEARYWLEAELPIPEDSATVVQATVLPAA